MRQHFQGRNGFQPHIYTTLLLSMLGACAQESRTPVEIELLPEGTDARTLFGFEATVNPGSGELEITRAFGRTAQAISDITLVQDGIPGVGPADTVELVTDWTSDDAGQCGFSSAFCGQVTMRSFFESPVGDMAVELVSVNPAAGHSVMNGDASGAYGGWLYSLLSPGGSFPRLWVFGNNGDNFTITGKVVGTSCGNDVDFFASTCDDGFVSIPDVSKSGG